MSELDPYVDYLRDQQATYQPNSEVAETLRGKTVIGFVGPACVGKSTVQELVIQQEPEAMAATTFTTRPDRGGSDASPYRYLPHTQDGLSAIKSKVEAGELVQYIVHPNGYVYGSRTTDYPGKYNFMAIVSAAIPAFQALPFKEVLPVALITEPDTWQEWFEERSEVTNPEESHKRLLEGRQSLQWCLGQSALCWVVNKANDAQAAADQVISIMHGNSLQNTEVRGTGRQLLARIESLLGE